MSRAQEIADEIAGSERFARMFSERVYGDEPILSTGREMLRHSAEKRDEGVRGQAEPASAPIPEGFQSSFLDEPLGVHDMREAIPRVSVPRLRETVPRLEPVQLPSRLQKLRRLERDNRNWAYLGGGSKLFFEQARLCADFTCDLLHDVDGPISWVLAAAAFPSYKVMNDEELVRYFCWRTRLRANETPKGPAVFLFVVSFELLVGVGAAPGEDTLAELSRIAESYRGVSEGFDSRISRWMYDYAIYHGLDATALKVGALRTRMTAVSCLRGAETALIRRGTKEGWPDRGAESLGLPSEGELLDALCSLSRYRAEKSRLVRGMRDDVALVCARVFARMVDHCHRRRKLDYVDGLFGGPVRASYLMFPQALFWSETRHPDTRIEIGAGESFVCENGVWWHVLPSRRQDTSREIGNLLHTIDGRMRQAMGDPHPLKPRTIPKYQSRFIDEEIERLIAEKRAREATRIEVDRRTLESIRSSASRVREALLTDEEREMAEPQGAGGVPTAHVVVVPAIPEVVRDEPVSTGAAKGAQASPVGALGLSEAQCELLRALLAGTELPASATSGFMSLEVDSINEAFLDVVGDTVLEYVDGELCLVEDYADDVAEMVSQG